MATVKIVAATIHLYAEGKKEGVEFGFVSPSVSGKVLSSEAKWQSLVSLSKAQAEALTLASLENLELYCKKLTGSTGNKLFELYLSVETSTGKTYNLWTGTIVSCSWNEVDGGALETLGREVVEPSTTGLTSKYLRGYETIDEVIVKLKIPVALKEELEEAHKTYEATVSVSTGTTGSVTGCKVGQAVSKTLAGTTAHATGTKTGVAVSTCRTGVQAGGVVAQRLVMGHVTVVTGVRSTVTSQKMVVASSTILAGVVSSSTAHGLMAASTVLARTGARASTTGHLVATSTATSPRTGTRVTITVAGGGGTVIEASCSAHTGAWSSTTGHLVGTGHASSRTGVSSLTRGWKIGVAQAVAARTGTVSTSTGKRVGVVDSFTVRTGTFVFVRAAKTSIGENTTRAGTVAAIGAHYLAVAVTHTLTGAASHASAHAVMSASLVARAGVRVTISLTTTVHVHPPTRSIISPHSTTATIRGHSTNTVIEPHGTSTTIDRHETRSGLEFA